MQLFETNENGYFHYLFFGYPYPLNENNYLVMKKCETNFYFSLTGKLQHSPVRMENFSQPSITAFISQIAKK